MKALFCFVIPTWPISPLISLPLVSVLKPFALVQIIPCIRMEEAEAGVDFVCPSLSPGCCFNFRCIQIHKPRVVSSRLCFFFSHPFSSTPPLTFSPSIRFSLWFISLKCTTSNFDTSILSFIPTEQVRIISSQLFLLHWISDPTSMLLCSPSLLGALSFLNLSSISSPASLSVWRVMVRFVF